MFSVEGTRITLSRGDTGAIDFACEIEGYTFTAADRALFTVKNGRGQVVKQGIYEISTMSDGETMGFTVTFYNADTDALPAGNYSWDIRFALSPQYDDSGKIVDGSQINTPMEPQRLTLLDVVGDI